MTTHFDDLYAEAKFSKSRIWGKVPMEDYSDFVDTRSSLKHNAGLVERSLRAKNQTNASVSTDTDGHRQTDRHGAIASIRTSIALRG